MADRDDIEVIFDTIERYADVVGKNIKINRLFLFGSFARGNSDKDSDIDVAVVSDDFSGDVSEDRLMLMKCRWDIDLRIEPMPFLSEDFVDDDPFVREIVATGREIVLN